MSNIKVKYKISSQNRLNVWGHTKLLNFKTNKWRWTSFKKKTEIFNSLFFVKHRRSLRFLFKSMVRLRTLLKYSRSVISEKHFRRFCSALTNKRYNYNLFLNKLNTRLDLILYNMGVLSSVFEIRQYVVHGHVFVNGHPIEQTNFFLKRGDLVEFSESLKYMIFSLLYSKKTVFKKTSTIFEINYNTFTLVVLNDISDLRTIPYTNSDNIELLSFC